MGLFSKKPEDAAITSITPASTPLDTEWFRGWWRAITAEAGVDVGDDQGQAELIWFTMHCLEDTARQTFHQVNDLAAYAAFQAGLEDDRSPAMMISLMVGWNPAMLAVLEQRLAKFRGLMVQAGQMHGVFRFGMSGLA